MNLFVFELKKVLSRRGFILLLIAALIINLFLNYRNECIKNPYPTSYNKVYSDIENMDKGSQSKYIENLEKKMDMYSYVSQGYEPFNADEDQKNLYKEFKKEYDSGNYFKYCSNINDEQKLCNSVSNDLKRVNNYKKSLENTEKNFENKTQMFIFSNSGTFSLHNVDKTIKDIKKVEKKDLPLSISQGVNLAVSHDFVGSDILILLLVLFTVMTLVTEEKSNGLFSITHPMLKGQGKLCVNKMFASSISSTIITVVIYFSDFMLGYILYGFGDVSRPIQSVSGFEGTFMNINVLQYFLIFAASKIAVFILISLIIFSFCTIAKSPVAVYLTFAIVFGAECALYLLIDENSSLGFFKYINIFAFMLTNPIYDSYYNVDVFSFAVGVIPLSIMFYIAIFLTFSYLGYFKFCSNKICSTSSKYGLLSFLPKSDKIRGSVKLANHESFKLFVANKGAFAIVIVILLEGLLFVNMQKSTYNTSENYKSYMMQLEGQVTQNKLDFIKSERAKFDKLHKKSDDLEKQVADGVIDDKKAESQRISFGKQLIPENEFKLVETRAEYLTSIGQKKNKTLSFVYDEGYDYIFDKNEDTTSYTNLLVMLIALIGSCAALFSIEETSGLALLVKSYSKGMRATVSSKIRISILISVPVFIISYFPTLINAFMHYSINELMAPASSLPCFEKMNNSLSLLSMIILLFLLRFLLCVAATVIILLISQLTRNTVTSLIISTALLVSPVIIHLLGVTAIDSFTLNVFASKLLLVDVNIVPIIIAVAVGLIISAICVILTDIHYCHNGFNFELHRRKKVTA